MLSSAGNQTHFKLAVCDNKTGEVDAFVDFENVFGFGDFAASLLQLIGHDRRGRFSCRGRPRDEDDDKRGSIRFGAKAEPPQDFT